MSLDKRYSHKFVNDLSGDPAIYMQNKLSGRSFIWDLACLDNLTEKEQLKIDQYLSVIPIWIILWVLIR